LSRAAWSALVHQESCSKHVLGILVEEIEVAQLLAFFGHVACLKASIEVNTETSAANADYKKVWDSIQAFRNDEYLWWQVAEYSYDTFMIRTRTRT
jgi:TRAP-type mannitol/chloroaromatic compound transport system substrate-binding protein